MSNQGPQLSLKILLFFLRLVHINFIKRGKEDSFICSNISPLQYVRQISTVAFGYTWACVSTSIHTEKAQGAQNKQCLLCLKSISMTSLPWSQYLEIISISFLSYTIDRLSMLLIKNQSLKNFVIAQLFSVDV